MELATSTLGVVGRYILSPRIFTLLEETERGAGGEIQLTDAIAKLLAEEPVMAYQFRGKRYDAATSWATGWPPWSTRCRTPNSRRALPSTSVATWLPGCRAESHKRPVNARDPPA